MLHTITSTRATYSSECVWRLLRCKEKAFPPFAPLGVGASDFSVVHICGAFAAGMRARAVSQQNADNAAVSANAIATVARAGGSDHEGARFWQTRSPGDQVFLFLDLRGTHVTTNLVLGEESFLC